MADLPDDNKHEGGIFIPYDKLLAQQSDKMDEILKEVRALSREKVSVVVFEQFRDAYEQKHEVVLQGVRESQEARKAFVPLVEAHDREIDLLKKDKVSRDAITEQNRRYLSGGALVGILVVLNIIVNAWQLTSGKGGLP